MKTSMLIGAAIMAASVLAAPAASPAQTVREEIEAVVRDYLAAHPDEVGAIVKDYMIKHPEAIAEIFAEVLKQRRSVKASAAPAASAKPETNRRTVIADHAPLLFSSAHQVTLGNPRGDVTLVEFFDYSCGFCKRALPDMLTLINDDPNLRIVLKELPILGPGSVEAARIAVAVRMQDSDGQKYLAFHRELLGGLGAASKDKALAAAKDQGLDMTRLERDAASDEVEATLSEDAKLASAMGVTGTPGYVVGDSVVLGAVGLVALRERIETARSRRTN
jgi:protein-disulfide isomerase